MKKYIFACIAMIISFQAAFSQCKLEIDIIAVRNDTGNIMLQLFNENEEVITQQIGQIKDSTCSFSINNLKPGKYAVRFYHDQNINGLMDTNKSGKPTEGYGFSNNVTGIFGPPPFKKWLFEIDGDKKIILKPTYYGTK
jgi:uncharacterized protein (DUF2141 family)